ncbi:MAG: hypothetical protein J6Q48_07425 [Bacteroidaceae bacterium]|nr:hypothetical protein [Bacteroidaceae bacterium]
MNYVIIKTDDNGDIESKLTHMLATTYTAEWVLVRVALSWDGITFDAPDTFYAFINIDNVVEYGYDWYEGQPMMRLISICTFDEVYMREVIAFPVIMVDKILSPNVGDYCYYFKDGQPIPCIILSGEYLSSDGEISNFWRWLDTTTGEIIDGYGDFYAIERR